MILQRSRSTFVWILKLKPLKLHIKYMVSSRCVTAVKKALKSLGVHYVVVHLGEVDVMENLSAEQLHHIKRALAESGLELMDDKKGVLVEAIKKTILDAIYGENQIAKVSFSGMLSQKLGHDYTHMANLFSEVMGTTIEHFIIKHKVERIKELMMIGDLSITEIAWRMNYSSVAHLSNQFKKITGFTPSYFKLLLEKKQDSIREIASGEPATCV